MTVTVNGHPRTIVEDASIAALLAELGLAESRVAVEVNASVIRKSNWPATALKENDRVEVVNFVGGG